jgi:hypothetical protein
MKVLTLLGMPCTATLLEVEVDRLVQVVTGIMVVKGIQINMDMDTVGPRWEEPRIVV